MATTASINAVTQDYANILFRTGSTAEINTWASQIDSGIFTQAGVASAIASSTEAVAIVDPIVRIYQAAFGRAPDSAGLKAWVTFANSNGGAANTSWQNTMASLFTQSAEFTTIYGSATPSAAGYAAALYQNVLNRVPDAGGLTAWTNALSAGTVSIATALTGFANSGEFVTNSNPTIQSWLTTYATTNSYVQSISIGKSAPVVATTQTFTTGADNFTGGAGTNLFFGDETNTTTYVSAADTITGGGGSSVNTFKVFGWKGGIPTMTGIQSIYIGNATPGNATSIYTFGSSTGITTLTIDNTAGTNYVGYTVPGATAITYQNDAAGKGIGIYVGSADTSVALTTNGIGTTTQAVLDLYGAALAAATISATGTTKIYLENTQQTSGAAPTGTMGVLKTLTLTGSGAITIDASDDKGVVAGNNHSTILTTIDASANTGAQVIQAPSAITTLKGGSAGGTYDVSLASATNVTMTFLTGATNTVLVSDADIGGSKALGLTNVSVVGAELSSATATINLAKVASAVNTLSIQGTMLDNGLNTAAIAAGGNTITFNAGTDTLNLGTSNWGNNGSIVAVANGTATNDVLTINMNSSTANFTSSTGGFTDTGFETVNLTLAAGAGTENIWTGNLAFNPTAGGTETVNISLNNSAGTYTLGGTVTLGGIGSSMKATGSGNLPWAACSAAALSTRPA